MNKMSVFAIDRLYWIKGSRVKRFLIKLLANHYSKRYFHHDNEIWEADVRQAERCVDKLTFGLF